MSTGSIVAVQSATEGDGSFFLQELVPAADKAALLFNISYLCLAKFPELERIIRSNATEVQMAFNSSETLLMKCINTSENMVTSLFPRLVMAVEKNNSLLAIRFLEKAKDWIQDIIREVQNMVTEYSKLTRDVGSATSDVILVKDQTDKKIAGLSKEEEGLKNLVAQSQATLKETETKVAQNKAAIDVANQELQKVVGEIAAKDKGLSILVAINPFIGSIIAAIVSTALASRDSQRLEGVRNKLADLRSAQIILAQALGRAQTQTMHWQFQLSKISFDLGAVPEPVHLPEVQQCLTRIQNILMQLKSFWEKIDVLLKNLKQKTFAGEDLTEFLEDCKEDFLKSIEIANTAWLEFKNGCSKVRVVFSVKKKDAYRFLEYTPSSLTPEQWQQKYNDLKARLDEYYPLSDAVEHRPAE